MIYHLVTQADWSRERDVLAEPAERGFVHCCDDRQIAHVRATYFPGDIEVLAVMVDPTRLRAETRYEPGSAGEPERFPHVYGNIWRDEALGVQVVAA